VKPFEGVSILAVPKALPNYQIVGCLQSWTPCLVRVLFHASQSRDLVQNDTARTNPSNVSHVLIATFL